MTAVPWRCGDGFGTLARTATVRVMQGKVSKMQLAHALITSSGGNPLPTTERGNRFALRKGDGELRQRRPSKTRPLWRRRPDC